MALSDKQLLIVPNVGQTADPKIVFSGADASTAAQNITLQVYPTNGGTLSFEGSTGQLFSIANTMTGTIFSANDVSGIPSIEVLDTGLIKLGQYGGNVVLGSGTDNGTDKLQVSGVSSFSNSVTTASLVLPGVTTLTYIPSILIPAGASNATTTGKVGIYNIVANAGYSPTSQMNVAGIFNFPQITSSGSADRIGLTGISNYAYRWSATDYSSYASNNINGYNINFGHLQTLPTTALTNNATGVKSTLFTQSATINTAYGFQSAATVGAAAGPANALVGTYYALHLGTPVYANGGSITNNYGIYQQDPAAINVFAGNVGINSTSPNAKLHVNQASSSEAQRWGYASDQASYHLSLTPIDTGAGAVYWTFQNYNTSNQASLTFRTTNIGIGTTNPGSTLHVSTASTGPLDCLLVESTGGNASISIKGAGTGNYVYQTFYQGTTGKFEMGITPTTSDFYINPNVQAGSTGTALYIQKSTGNVGIGTTAPNEKLEVAGNIVIGSTNWLYGWNASSVRQPLIRSRGMGYAPATYPGVQIGQTGDHIALFIDPNTITTGNYSGTSSEIMIPNVVYFCQSNAAGTDWLPGQSLTLSNGNVGMGVAVPIVSRLQVQAKMNSLATSSSETYTGGGRGHAEWPANGGPSFNGYSNITGAGMGGYSLYNSLDNPGGDAGGIITGGPGTYVTGGGAGVVALGGDGGYYASGGAGIYAKGGLHGSWAIAGQENGNTRAWAGYFDGNLYVSSNISAAGDITAYASDERLKENITPITNALAKVKAITGVSYNWNSLAKSFEFTNGNDKTQIGVLAQDVQKVLPEIVVPAPFDNNNGVSKSGENYLTVKYEKLTPLLIEAIKEQASQIELLQQQVKSLLALVENK